MSHSDMQNAKLENFVVFLQSITGNMMNLGIRQIFAALSALFLSIIVPAQDIPVLPADPAVLKGVMSNGLCYYLVTNPTQKGVADFAVVQRTGKLNVPDSTGVLAVSAADSALSSLKRLGASSPREFMGRHGVIPEMGGFVKVTDDATVFRFSDVRLNGAPNVLDSTLLVMMDIVDRANYIDDEFLGKWYSAADQAVIVSGDIDAKAIETRLRHMSLMVPSRESAARREFESGSHSEAVFMRNGGGQLAQIIASWTSKRAPREYMNTVQPEIFEMSVNSLGRVAAERIKQRLKETGVPFADVSYDHICSESHPYDDSFSIMATVDSADAGKALEAVAAVMASIDAAGAGKDEYLLAESAYLQELAMKSDESVRFNDDYVDRCINAFLYNSSLASSKERRAFHTSRNLPDTMRLRLFNGVAQALIDGSANLTVASPADTSISGNIFNSAWTAAKEHPLPSISVNMSDTLSFPETGAKVRLRSTKKEPVSDGSVWTFSNGFKVIYKKMPSDRVHYTLAMNGGYGSITGLQPGEGAFMSDYIGTCNINGLKAKDFFNVLKMAGLNMDVSVSVSNMMVSGDLPKDRMTLLLRSLLSMANGTTADKDGFEYYRESEYLALDMAKGGPYARMTAIDSIMCPDYRYSPYKTKGKMADGFRTRAEAFFEDRFSKMNDGALILVGNLDEERLKKLLSEYVGGFRTSDVASRRSAVRYQPVSGWSTYTVDGDYDNVDVAISARMPVTMENFIAAELASMILQRELVKGLRDDEKHLSLSYNCRIYPEERLNMFIAVPGASLNTLADLRTVLSGIHRIGITNDDLKPYKESLKNRVAYDMKTPSFWVHAIVLRYLDGKDLTSNYAAKIDAVTPEKVMSILNLLDDGSKVEYVTYKRN